MNHDNNSGWNEIHWWATLVVAVFAVPSFGLVVAALVPATGIVQVIVFVLACWLCTFLGMKLMQNPKMQERINLTGKK